MSAQETFSSIRKTASEAAREAAEAARIATLSADAADRAAQAAREAQARNADPATQAALANDAERAAQEAQLAADKAAEAAREAAEAKAAQDAHAAFAARAAQEANAVRGERSARAAQEANAVRGALSAQEAQEAQSARARAAAQAALEAQAAAERAAREAAERAAALAFAAKAAQDEAEAEAGKAAEAARAAETERAAQAAESAKAAEAAQSAREAQAAADRAALSAQAARAAKAAQAARAAKEAQSAREAQAAQAAQVALAKRAEVERAAQAARTAEADRAAKEAESAKAAQAAQSVSVARESAERAAAERAAIAAAAALEAENARNLLIIQSDEAGRFDQVASAAQSSRDAQFYAARAAEVASERAERAIHADRAARANRDNPSIQTYAARADKEAHVVVAQAAAADEAAQDAQGAVIRAAESVTLEEASLAAKDARAAAERAAQIAHSLAPAGSLPPLAPVASKPSSLSVPSAQAGTPAQPQPVQFDAYGQPIPQQPAQPGQYGAPQSGQSAPYGGQQQQAYPFPPQQFAGSQPVGQVSIYGQPAGISGAQGQPFAQPQPAQFDAYGQPIPQQPAQSGQYGAPQSGQPAPYGNQQQAYPFPPQQFVGGQPAGQVSTCGQPAGIPGAHGQPFAQPQPVQFDAYGQPIPQQPAQPGQYGSPQSGQSAPYEGQRQQQQFQQQSQQQQQPAPEEGRAPAASAPAAEPPPSATPAPASYVRPMSSDVLGLYSSIPQPKHQKAAAQESHIDADAALRREQIAKAQQIKAAQSDRYAHVSVVLPQTRESATAQQSVVPDGNGVVPSAVQTAAARAAAQYRQVVDVSSSRNAGNLGAESVVPPSRFVRAGHSTDVSVESVSQEDAFASSNPISSEQDSNLRYAQLISPERAGAGVKRAVTFAAPGSFAFAGENAAPPPVPAVVPPPPVAAPAPASVPASVSATNASVTPPVLVPPSGDSSKSPAGGAEQPAANPVEDSTPTDIAALIRARSRSGKSVTGGTSSAKGDVKPTETASAGPEKKSSAPSPAELPRKPDSRPVRVAQYDDDEEDEDDDDNPDIADFADDEKTGGKNRWGVILLILLLIGVLAAGAVWAWQHLGAKEAGPTFRGEYRVEQVRNGSLAQVIKTTGTINPQNQVTVSSELSNILVQEVYVESNARVTKGQKLAQLDTEKLNQAVVASQAALNSAEATVRATEATRQKTKADHARNKKLFEDSRGQIPAKQGLDASEAAAERAEAEYAAALKAVEKARAQYEINNTDLKKATITSPMDGFVLKRSIEPGQTVVSRLTPPELFIIADDLKRMKLVVGIAEKDISRVAVGQEAAFQVPAWPRREYRAKVAKVENNPVTTNNVVTYNIELEVSNDDLSLKAGMSAATEIHAGKRENVFYVPNAAFRFDPNNRPAGNEKKEKTLVENMTPFPPRRGFGGGRGQKDDQGGVASVNGKKQIYVLNNGKIKPIEVTVGLETDQFTQISGSEVSTNLVVVTGYK